MPGYVLRSLGCKANFADGQAIERELRKRGWAPTGPGEVADLCVVNSCTVTDEADRQSRKLASRLKKLNPRARVVVTGCAADVDPERMRASVGVDYVVGNIDKPRLVELVLGKFTKEPKAAPAGERLGHVLGYGEIFSQHPLDREWPGVEGEAPDASELASLDRTRAFVKIQEGCNSFCTYCIIPYGRGPARSLDPERVIALVEDWARAGTAEVILTGTNLGDYGADLSDSAATEPAGLGFFRLVREILARTSIPRLRLSSLDPVEIRPELIALMREEPRLCPHFHVSLQSPHSKILRLMKRKYRTAEVERTLGALAQVRGPNAAAFVGMDVITGFPGETDADFRESVRLLEGMPWSRLHVFPYSERAGTPATRLPDAVATPVRAARAQELRTLSLRRMQAHYASAAPVLASVLLEKPDQAGISGYTPDYLRVQIPRAAQSSMQVRGAQICLPRPAVVADLARGEVSFQI